MPFCTKAQHSKADESVGSAASACEVNAAEREDDEEITYEESDDTVNGAHRGVMDPLGFIESNIAARTLVALSVR